MAMNPSCRSGAPLIRDPTGIGDGHAGCKFPKGMKTSKQSWRGLVVMVAAAVTFLGAQTVFGQGSSPGDRRPPPPPERELQKPGKSPFDPPLGTQPPNAPDAGTNARPEVIGGANEPIEELDGFWSGWSAKGGDAGTADGGVR
jgi:hypothetical protein